MTDPEEKARVVEFLKEFDLTFTGNIDYTMGLFDDGKLIGTGSLGGRVMRDIAISKDYQKRGLPIVSSVTSRANPTAAALQETKSSPSRRTSPFCPYGFQRSGRSRTLCGSSGARTGHIGRLPEPCPFHPRYR